MINIDKKMLFLKMMTLLIVSQVGISFAVPTQTYEELEQRAPVDLRLAVGSVGCRMANPAGEALMGFFYNGRGFALKDDESHELMLNVENLMPPDPMQVRRLLASKKSIEEIRDEINAIQGKAVYGGSIRLDEMIYPMVDIKVYFSSKNSTALSADVVEPMSDLAISDERVIMGNNHSQNSVF